MRNNETTEKDPAKDFATQDFKKWFRYAMIGTTCSMAGATIVVKISSESFDPEKLAQFPITGWLWLLSMVSIAWICNGLRTWILSRVVGHPIRWFKAIAITLSMEFAIAATPGGVGGMITRIGLQKKEGMSYQKSTSLMSADWIADLLFFILLAPFGFWQILELIPWDQISSPLKHLQIKWLLIGLLVVLMTGISGILLRKHLLNNIPTSIQRTVLTFLKKLQHAILKHRSEIRRTFTRILSHHRLDYLIVLLLASIQWTCRYGVLYVILMILGADVHPIMIMLIQGFLFMLGLFIVAPGGGGSVEILTSLILAPLVGPAIATVAVLIWRFFTYYAYLISGGIAFFLNLRSVKTTHTQNIASSGLHEQC